MGYGTGAVMAVPAHDERDHRFAKKFGLEIINVIENDVDIQEESYDSKDSVCVNSEFLNGLNYNDAKAKIISEIEKMESVTELPITDSVMRFSLVKDIGETRSLL